MKTFTTDQATYEIEERTDRRVDDFINGQPVWVESTTYRILKDGKLVSVAYDKTDIAYVIDCQENSARYAGINSRFD